MVAGDLIRKEKRMRASNDNSRAMPSHSIWLFAVAWVLLGLNTIYLAERAYDIWATFCPAAIFSVELQ